MLELVTVVGSASRPCWVTGALLRTRWVRLRCTTSPGHGTGLGHAFRSAPARTGPTTWARSSRLSSPGLCRSIRPEP